MNERTLIKEYTAGVFTIYPLRTLSSPASHHNPYRGHFAPVNVEVCNPKLFFSAFLRLALGGSYLILIVVLFVDAFVARGIFTVCVMITIITK